MKRTAEQDRKIKEIEAEFRAQATISNEECVEKYGMTLDEFIEKIMRKYIFLIEHQD